MPDKQQRWFCDGYELTDPGVDRGIESYEGMFTSPTLLATDISVAQRDGELPGVARLSPGGFTLRFWLGRNSRISVEEDWEHLLKVMVKRHRLVMFERRRPDGTARQCFGRVVGRIAPTPIGQLGVRAQIEVTVPSGTWQDTAVSDTTALSLTSNGPLIPVGWDDPRPGQVLMEDEVPPKDPNGGVVSDFQADGTAVYTHGWTLHRLLHTFTRTGAPVSGPMDRYVELPQFAGASAPMTKLKVQVTGPLPAGFSITCPETGTWASYDLGLAADESVLIDAGADTVYAPRVDAFRYKGPYMAEVMNREAKARPPIIRVAADQASDGASIRVQGRRLYLTM